MSTDLPSLGDPDRMQAMVYGYDQLHRIVQARSLTSSETTGFVQRSYNPENPNKYDADYSYDPNGNLLTLQRRDETTIRDDLTYKYYDFSNKLKNVDGTDTENYTYDEIGNLVSDNAEGIDSIAWTPYGKVRAVFKDDSSQVRFRYDASGNRIAKITETDTTIYARDASGNVMAVYRNDTLTEQSIYGSSRLGLINYASKTAYRSLGGKKYELSNHLGNVLAVVSDNIHLDQDSTWASVVNITDYYPFGLAMDGRSVQDSTYRYGFNGLEGDDEINGPKKSYTTEFRQYDPVVGRWWGVDALTGQMPDWSPYNFGFNSPLRYVDPTGLAPDDWVKDKDGNVRWRENVNSAEDIDPLSGDTYLGKSGVGLDESSGNTQFFNSDGTIDEGVRSMAEFTVTASATSHGKVMSNPVVKDMKANSARIRSEALPFARHMTRSTIDGIGYTGAGISAVGTAVTPFIPHLGVGLLAVGGSVSTISGVASATMNFAEGDISGGFGDVGMMVVGKYGSTLIKNMRNRRRIINWTEQVVLESTLESSLNIADGIRANLQDKK